MTRHCDTRSFNKHLEGKRTWGEKVRLSEPSYKAAQRRTRREKKTSADKAIKKYFPGVRSVLRAQIKLIFNSVSNMK